MCIDSYDAGELTVLSFVAGFQEYLLDPLSPMAWAGLGSCVYLLKRLTDIAAERQFDSAFLQGWKTRILLGAVLGGVILYIFDTDFIVGTEFDSNGVAFLTGLGVKVVYGALEKLVDTLAIIRDYTIESTGRISQGVAEFVNQRCTYSFDEVAREMPQCISLP